MSLFIIIVLYISCYWTFNVAFMYLYNYILQPLYHDSIGQKHLSNFKDKCQGQKENLWNCTFVTYGKTSLCYGVHAPLRSVSVPFNCFTYFRSSDVTMQWEWTRWKKQKRRGTWLMNRSDRKRRRVWACPSHGVKSKLCV